MEQIKNDIECAFNRLNCSEDDLSDLRLYLENIYNKVNNLKPKTDNSILDLELFKNKLELYGLKSEELWNFIDDYMRLYNKE